MRILGYLLREWKERWSRLKIYSDSCRLTQISALYIYTINNDSINIFIQRASFHPVVCYTLIHWAYSTAPHWKLRIQYSTELNALHTAQHSTEHWAKDLAHRTAIINALSSHHKVYCIKNYLSKYCRCHCHLAGTYVVEVQSRHLQQKPFVRPHTDLSFHSTWHPEPWSKENRTLNIEHICTVQ